MPSNFGPHAAGSITFRVGNVREWVEDPVTGNYVPGPGQTVALTYEVAMNLSPASNNNAPGTELVQYMCQGRLLSPTTLDPRIAVGAIGTATLHNMEGRFILTDLGHRVDPAYRPYLRQQISGTFEQAGAGSYNN